MNPVEWRRIIKTKEQSPVEILNMYTLDEIELENLGKVFK